MSATPDDNGHASIPAAERRESMRRPGRGTVFFRVADRPKGFRSHAVIVDISAGGLSMLASGFVEAESLLEIELQPPDGDPGLTRHAEVRWLVAQPMEGYCIGCRWTEPLAPAVLVRFV